MITRSLAVAKRIMRLPSRGNHYRIVPEDKAVRVLGQATRKSLAHRFTLICWNMYKARRRFRAPAGSRAARRPGPSVSRLQRL
jgi:hypothetical protein